MNKKCIFLLPQLIVVLYFLGFSPSFAQGVSLMVGNGTGLPGSRDVPVEVSLDNSTAVTRVEMYLCDVDDYLHNTGCTGIGRASGMSCLKSEISGGYYDGCVWIELSGGSITSGTDAILNLTFNVNSGAPEGECRDLNPEVLDPSGVTTTSGQFCFKCTSDQECLDSLHCNGEEICDLDGVCQPGSTPCPDDGLYCNGTEECDEFADSCFHSKTECSDGSTNPGDWCYDDGECPDGTCELILCDKLICDEVGGSCYCDADLQCDDGLYCSGVESCNLGSGICQPGSNPCGGSTPFCDEGEVRCYPEDVTLTVASFSGYPGTDHEVDVSLENPVHEVIGVNFDICDPGDDLICVWCIPKGDAVGLRCDVSDHQCSDQSQNPGDLCLVDDDCPGGTCDPVNDGCCGVNLVGLGGNTIRTRSYSRPIFSLIYHVADIMNTSGCRDLNPENLVVANAFPPPQELRALVVPGEFCDTCGGDFECDGDVDGTDAFKFKADFGRWDCETINPCNGDFLCDGDVDGTDAFEFKSDFGRWDCGTPCAPGPYCSY